LSPKPVAYDHERQCWVQYVGKAIAAADEGDDQFPDREEIWKVVRCGHIPGAAFVLANGGKLPKGVRDCYACKHAGERHIYPKGGPTKL
jgi:hypothetical protein